MQAALGRVEDQAYVLVDMALRGDFGDVLGAMEPLAARNAAKAAVRALAPTPLIPEDAGRLVTGKATSAPAVAAFVAGLPPRRGAALLLAMHARGAPTLAGGGCGPVLNRMKPQVI